jgi:type IV pilus assembly protein PilE
MRGFSLIELLVAMAIAGLLAAIALPGYSKMMMRAQRQDARLALLRLQHQQEIIFANHLSYLRPVDRSAPEAAPPGRSEQGYYLLELRMAANGMSYTALAHADPARRQAGDLHCAWLSIDETGRRRSADASGNWRDDDPYRCWR